MQAFFFNIHTKTVAGLKKFTEKNITNVCANGQVVPLLYILPSILKK